MLNSKAQEISRLLGREIYQKVVDVSSYEQVAKVADDVLKKYSRLDRVIYMAGIYEPMKTDDIDPKITAKIIEINLTGAFNTVSVVTPILKRQKYGQIAICGSLSGYIGLPNSQPYASTKAGLINLAETLRVDLYKKVDIKLINPGFVSTRLTKKNTFKMPGLMTPAEAAVVIRKGLDSKKFEIHFPKQLSLTLKFISLMPYLLSNLILRKMNIK